MLCIIWIEVVLPSNANDPLPWANPWDVGMDYEFVNQAFTDLAAAVNENKAPGAVGLILKDGKMEKPDIH